MEQTAESKETKRQRNRRGGRRARSREGKTEAAAHTEQANASEPEQVAHAGAAQQPEQKNERVHAERADGESREHVHSRWPPFAGMLPYTLFESKNASRAPQCE
jgi:hypothetical protein